MRFWFVFLGVALLAVGCASSPQQAELNDTSPTTSTAVESLTVAPTTTTTTTVATTLTSTSATEPEPQSTEAAPEAPSTGCRRVVDFAALTQDWVIVNDGVMGGLSEGTGQVVDGALLFEGVINTNGGGFSSVRSIVPAGTFDGASSLRIRLRTEYARTYEFIIDVAIEGLDRRVSYFGEIASTAATEFQEVEVSFADFEPRIFGAPVDAPAIDQSQINGLGIILADGSDGDFSLAVEWIDACE